MSKWLTAIENDLKWRTAELTELRLRIRNEAPVPKTAPQSVAYKALLRAAWAMLYAHYEGFCLNTLSIYLDAIENLNVMRKECREPLMQFSLQHHFPKARNLEEDAFYKYLRKDFESVLSSPIEFPRSKQRKDEFELKGRSNLWPNQLADCCDFCCVTCAAVDATDLRLKALVGRRNSIAHGKDTPVRDHFEFEEYETHVIGVLDKFVVAVDAALGECEYLDPLVRHRSLEALARRLWHQTGRGDLDNWFEAGKRLSEGERA